MTPPTSPNSSPELTERDHHMKILRQWGTATPAWAADYIESLEALSSKNELPSEIEADLHRLKTQAQVGPAAVTLIEKQAAAILSLQRRLDEALTVFDIDPDDMRIIGDWLEGERGPAPGGRVKGLWQSCRRGLEKLAALNPKDTGR